MFLNEKILTLLVLAVAAARGQSCSSPIVQAVTIQASTASKTSPLIIPIVAAASNVNIHVCVVSLPLSGLATTQLQQTNGSTNTPTGPTWISAGPYANLNASVTSGLGNGLSISVNAPVTGGGIVTYYSTNP